MPEKIEDLFEFYDRNHHQHHTIALEQTNKTNSKFKKILKLFRNVRREKSKGPIPESEADRNGRKDKRKRYKNSEEREEMMRRNIENSWIELPTTLQRKKEKISQEILSEYHDPDASDPGICNCDNDHSLYESIDRNLVTRGYQYPVDGLRERDGADDSDADTSPYTRMNGSRERKPEETEKADSIPGIDVDLRNPSPAGSHSSQNDRGNNDDDDDDGIGGSDSRSDADDSKPKGGKSDPPPTSRRNSENSENDARDENANKNKCLFNAAVKEMNMIFHNLATQKYSEDKDVFKVLEMNRENDDDKSDLYENMNGCLGTGEISPETLQDVQKSQETSGGQNDRRSDKTTEEKAKEADDPAHAPDDVVNDNNDDDDDDFDDDEDDDESDDSDVPGTPDSLESASTLSYCLNVMDDGDDDDKTTLSNETPVEGKQLMEVNLKSDGSEDEKTAKTVNVVKSKAEEGGTLENAETEIPIKLITQFTDVIFALPPSRSRESRDDTENGTDDDDDEASSDGENKSESGNGKSREGKAVNRGGGTSESDTVAGSDNDGRKGEVKEVKVFRIESGESPEKSDTDATMDEGEEDRKTSAEEPADPPFIQELMSKLTDEEKAKKKSAEAIAKELASHIFGRRMPKSKPYESSNVKQTTSGKSNFVSISAICSVESTEESERGGEPPAPNVVTDSTAKHATANASRTTDDPDSRTATANVPITDGEDKGPSPSGEEVTGARTEDPPPEVVPNEEPNAVVVTDDTGGETAGTTGHAVTNAPETGVTGKGPQTSFSVADWWKLVAANPDVTSPENDTERKSPSSKLTVPEILKRFEELGNKHFSDELSITEDERTLTLKQIYHTLMCLEEKVRNFENWNELVRQNQQYHEGGGRTTTTSATAADRSAESWTGRGPQQRSPQHPIPVRNHQENEEEIVQTSINDGKHSLLQFAMHYFRQSPEKFEMLKTADGSISGSLKVIEGKNKKSKEKGKNGKNSSEWTWKEQVDLVKFTAKPISQSLLQLDTPELSDLAVECFVCLMRYMGDLPMPTDISEVKCVYTILMHCHKFEQLRDEVYCQLMKQTTNNKSIQQESCQRGWRLFSIVAAYFISSDTLKPFLFKYLETAAYDKRRAYHGTAMVCLQNLRKTFKYGGRKNVPSVEEITAISAGRNSKRQIYRLPGGTEKVVNTKSTTVVQDVIEELCVMINVTNPQEMEEFSVYCIVEGDTFTMPLAREEYILDVTTELQKNHQVFYLIFCRSVWYFPLRLDSQLYVEVVFNQIAPDYLEGLLLVMPGESLEQDVIYDISKIAALLHKAADMTHVPSMKETKFLLPKPALSVRDVKPSQWVNMVQSNWQDCEVLTTIQAKAQVLDVLSKWPLFGSSFFAVKKAVESKDRTDHILALNRNGVHFIDLITHETLLHYPFSEVISTRKVKSEDGTLFLDMKCGNLMQQRITRLQTDQAHEISRLIRQYITMQQRMGANN